MIIQGAKEVLKHHKRSLVPARRKLSENMRDVQQTEGHPVLREECQGGV